MDKVKNNYIDLLKLLAVTFKERDEAQRERDELKALLSNFLPLKQPETALVSPIDLHIQTPNLGQNNEDSYTIIPDKLNNNSETSTYSHFYADLSPENYSLINAFPTQSGWPNINIAPSASTGSIEFPSDSMVTHAGVAKNSPGNNNTIIDDNVTDDEMISDLVLDRLVEGKPLPEKGKLLQAVVDAGPLLQALLLRPPLPPQWQNPTPPTPTTPSLQHLSSNTSASDSRCAMQSWPSLSEVHEINIPHYGHGDPRVLDPQMSYSSLFGATEELVLEPGNETPGGFHDFLIQPMDIEEWDSIFFS